jgi:hypothetical protein
MVYLICKQMMNLISEFTVLLDFFAFVSGIVQMTHLPIASALLERGRGGKIVIARRNDEAIANYGCSLCKVRDCRATLAMTCF